MLPVRKLCFILLFEILCPLALGSVELSKVALVVVETLTVLMNDICRNGIQERSVVRAKEQRRHVSIRLGDAEKAPTLRE